MNSAIALSTGRACLNLTLQELKPTKVYLPFFCCNAVYEPLDLLGIEYQFYEINLKLELEDNIKLKDGELLIYCDFYGLKSSYVDSLISIYKDRIVIDNTHNYFHKNYENNYSFTSARKYFGVPDGAFLYTPSNKINNQDFERNTAVSISHNYFRLIGEQSKGYNAYTKYEETLNSEVKSISLLSERLLKSVNYKEVRKQRIENFSYLHNAFKENNELNFSDSHSSPFCYPLLLKDTINRKEIYEKSLFVPTLWGDVLVRNGNENYKNSTRFSRDVLPLPIDHRYSLEDMEYIVTIIKRLIDEK
jgi:hypothetical protein